MFLSMVALGPHQSAAMTIERFDGMVAEDQRHYVVFLVKEAQKLFVQQNKSELAQNVERIFREIPAGESRSRGDTQFETSMRAARRSLVRMSLRSAPSSEVENAFCDALFRLGIRPAPAFFAAFGPATRNRVFFQKESRF